MGLQAMVLEDMRSESDATVDARCSDGKGLKQKSPEGTRLLYEVLELADRQSRKIYFCWATGRVGRREVEVERRITDE